MAISQFWLDKFWENRLSGKGGKMSYTDFDY